MFSKLRRAKHDLKTMNELFPNAELIARNEGAPKPAAEHLLLAAIDLDDNTASDALGEFGVDRPALREAIKTQHSETLLNIGLAVDDDAIDAVLPQPTTPTGLYQSEGSAQRLFQRAVALAKLDRSNLYSGHVLIAATELEEGTLARSLRHLAIDPTILRSVTKRRLAELNQ